MKTQALFLISVFAFSSGIGAFLSLLISRFVKSLEKKQQFSDNRVVSGSLLISIGIIALSLALVRKDFLSFITSLEKSDYIFYGLIFSVSILTLIFFRRLFPILFALYLIYVTLSLLFLFIYFGPQKNNLFRFSYDQILCNSRPIDDKVSEEMHYVEVHVFELNEKFLLPGFSRWYRICFPEEKKIPKFIQEYYINQNSRYIQLELPHPEFLPAEYVLYFEFTNAEPYYKYRFKKIL